MSVLLAFACTHYQYPPVGYEGVIFISSVAVMLALGAALLSLVLAGLLLFRRQPPKPWDAMVVASLSIGLALTYAWLL